jgi:PPM family protein phosphatase
MNTQQTEYVKSTSAQPKAAPAPSIKIAGMVAQHLGDRKEQQDRVAIFGSKSAPKCALAILADGMGGRSGGAIAAETAMITAQRLFDEFDPNTTTASEFFHALVHEAHTSIQIAAFASRMEPHSTLVACIIQPNRVDWCHVGDSRLYAYRNGRQVHQTLDHTVAMKMVQEGTLPADRARLHPSAAKLTNALGAKNAPIATITGFPNTQVGDRFFLCSDGCWAYFKDNELEYLLHNTNGVNRTRLLIDEARTRANGSGDNCSLCVIELVPGAAE